MRVFFAVGFAIFMSTASASAIDLPMTSADVHAAISYGTTTSSSEVLSGTGHNLGDGESALQPWGQIITPFALLAFASSQAHAKYQDVSSELIRETKAAKTFTIMAEAFNTGLHMNDDMVIVIKQNGKVIHPVKKALSSDEEVLTIGDQAGYRTSLSAEFSYKTLNLNSPFTAAIANYSMNGQETDFPVDPTTFR
jgi:hypothetical protein